MSRAIELRGGLIVALALIDLLALVASSIPPKDETTSTLARKRIMKEFRDINKSDSVKNGFVAVELDGENIYEWRVKLTFKNHPESQIRKDLKKLKDMGKGEDYVTLAVTYGPNYPNQPPLVRVVSPTVVGGHSRTDGGFCMEILNTKNWHTGFTTESIISSVAATFAEDGGRIDFHPLCSKKPKT